MAFTTHTESYDSFSGVYLEGRPFNVLYVDIKDGEEENVKIGKAVSFDTNGEVVPYDGTNFDGVMVGSAANDVTKEYQAQVLTTGYVVVDKVAGETFVLGNGIDIDTDGSFKVGSDRTKGVFIEEKIEDETILVSINLF